MLEKAFYDHEQRKFCCKMKGSKEYIVIDDYNNSIMQEILAFLTDIDLLIDVDSLAKKSSEEKIDHETLTKLTVKR